MITAYGLGENGLEQLPAGEGNLVPANAVWIDLFQPTLEEETSVEAFLDTSIPTREESEEIEFSSRFYDQDGSVFMTVSVITGVGEGRPTLAPFTIVIAGDKIASVRYDDLRALRQFVVRAGKPAARCTTAPAVFLGIIESIVDRTADVLEHVGAGVDNINLEVFTQDKDARQRSRQLSNLIEAIGAQGDLTAKTRESLASLERLVQYAGVALPSPYDKGTNRARLKLAGRDIRSLEDHVTFLSNKINFLLDATLGMISVQQNEVIRVLTVAATIFFPPTLIGTVYGMNFTDMPELHWSFGYPFAIGLMIASAVLPYLFFKRRGWL